MRGCVADGGAAEWTWMGGATQALRYGVYGRRGVASAENAPGARRYAAAWVDTEGAFWLFGGWGYARGGPPGYLDDLWRFDGRAWTWVAGSDGTDQHGVYGSGADSGAGPGGRDLAAAWVDAEGGLWLFGGYGQGSGGMPGYLGDAWRFDGRGWTWVGGSSVSDAPGQVEDGGWPGARAGATVWGDDGGVWLFGGRGSGVDAGVGTFSDLWRFDGGRWTLIDGHLARADAPSRHGVKGELDGGSVPGGLQLSASWRGVDGALWLFGGEEAALEASSNDLWRFDGARWTWETGSGLETPRRYTLGLYGERGSPGPANSPGSRRAAVSWTDACGGLWLLGGYGWGLVPGPTHGPGPLADLWRFDGTSWAWMAGSNLVDQPGRYGGLEEGAEGAVPGGRYGAASWVDAHGDVWLFGGRGIDATGAQGELNDLWRLEVH